MNPKILAAVRRAILTVATMALATPAFSEVVRVTIASKEPVLGGMPFGSAGPYQKLVGTIHFALDPENAYNKDIVDLERAPRDPQGRIEFSSDLFVLRPVNASRGNGVVLLDVINRGNKQLLTTFNLARGSADPQTAEDFGDGFLMQQGFTIVAVGWELAARGGIALYPPIATTKDGPITGWIRNWFVPDEAAASFDLTSSLWTGFKSYPPLDTGAQAYRLTERKGFFAPARPLPRTQWRFGRVSNGVFDPDPTYITLEGGFKPGFVYELAYVTKDPRVMGTGFAALRDAAAYFKHAPNAEIRAHSCTPTAPLRRDGCSAR